MGRPAFNKVGGIEELTDLLLNQDRYKTYLEELNSKIKEYKQMLDTVRTKQEADVLLARAKAKMEEAAHYEQKCKEQARLEREQIAEQRVKVAELEQACTDKARELTKRADEVAYEATALVAVKKQHEADIAEQRQTLNDNTRRFLDDKDEFLQIKAGWEDRFRRMKDAWGE
jgi:chromosome segregation ATPase